MITLIKNINGVFVVVVIAAFILGWQLGHRDYQLTWQNFKPNLTIVNQEPPQDVNLDFKLFWHVWNLLFREYIDKKALDPTKLYFGAIQGMVAAIDDPYTAFLPPAAQKMTKEQLNGSFEGVGIQLGFNKEKRLVVIAPLKNTPADRAGIKAGDLILTIDEKDTTSISLPEAVSLIRGPKGTSVTLTIYSEGEHESKKVKLIRDTIIVKTVEYENKTTPRGKKIAYLRLASFGEKTYQEWDEAVGTALANGVDGVLLDVRNNPGGYLEGAVYLVSEFLPTGKIIVIQENARGEREELKVQRQGKMQKLPLVILINKGSASASEIVAGAVQDYQRGILVGEKSFGKGTIQSAEDLPQNTGIHITTAKWLTPAGRWIHNSGLTPDVLVELTEQDDDGKADIQLEKALTIFDK